MRRRETSARCRRSSSEASSSSSAPVDILVNNAGIARDAHIMLMDAGRWHEVLDVNLDGAYYCTRAVVRGMLLRRWGRIINITSPSARMPLPGQTNYAASKAGLEGFTRALSRDLAAKGVLVNAVSPGLIETEMLAEHAGGRRASATCTRSRSGGPARRAKWPRWSRFSRPTRRLHHGAGHRRRRRAALSPDGPDTEHVSVSGRH